MCTHILYAYGACICICSGVHTHIIYLYIWVYIHIHECVQVNKCFWFYFYVLIYIYICVYVCYPTGVIIYLFGVEMTDLANFPGCNPCVPAPALCWSLKVIRRDSYHKCVPEHWKNSNPEKPAYGEARSPSDRWRARTRVIIHDTWYSCSWILRLALRAVFWSGLLRWFWGYYQSCHWNHFQGQDRAEC